MKFATDSFNKQFQFRITILSLVLTTFGGIGGEGGSGIAFP